MKPPEKIDHIADDLDDLKTTVDEIEDDPPAGVSHDALNTLKDALERASDAADEIENEQK